MNAKIENWKNNREGNEECQGEQNFPIDQILSLDIPTEVRDWLLGHTSKIVAIECTSKSPTWRGIFTNIKGDFWFQMAQHNYLLQLNKKVLNKICKRLLSRKSLTYWEDSLCWYVRRGIRPKWRVEEVIRELEKGKAMYHIKEVERAIQILKEWYCRRSNKDTEGGYEEKISSGSSFKNAISRFFEVMSMKVEENKIRIEGGDGK